MHPQGGPPQKIALPGIKHVVAVASGKGGVGKSTVAVNLALALHLQAGASASWTPTIYAERPHHDGRAGRRSSDTAFPLERYGISLMSMGFLVKPEQAVIWRGPMVDRYIRQFLMALPWATSIPGDRSPPGTGDAQLTLTQAARSRRGHRDDPQEVSLIDARKGLEMFRQVRVPSWASSRT